MKVVCCEGCSRSGEARGRHQTRDGHLPARAGCMEQSRRYRIKRFSVLCEAAGL